MQFKLTFVAAALATLVVATPTPNSSPPPPTSSCSTGNQQCCQLVQSVTQATDSGLLSGLLGILVGLLGDVTGLIGSDCSPVNILGGGTCTAQAVCCTNNNVGGLISVGCIPITL
ncbi:fungal hydrophobin-domain-containing protein [Rhodocollybia butyracea]|uniref:Hydrophobin n=1 Tax=Rhodocollybia butyracea TaxID=206335 RepID=A0A9P5PHP4_9AGAR|nr:fungal hydrophobin-domain-containing protein [Rhodocollybia butyracea]